MKKIAFMTMTMQQTFDALYYLSEKSKHLHGGKIYFPLNVVLADNLHKNDELTVCIIKMTDNLTPSLERNFDKYLERYKNEIESINKSIGAKIEYTIIDSDFVETRDAFGKRFMDLFDVLSDGVKIYADITFGTKPTSLIIMNVLHFAEKFFDADVDSVIYGKTGFIKKEDGNSVADPKSAKVCDVTVLYLLNNLTYSMNADSGDEARDAMKVFFGM